MISKPLIAIIRHYQNGQLFKMRLARTLEALIFNAPRRAEKGSEVPTAEMSTTEVSTPPATSGITSRVSQIGSTLQCPGKVSNEAGAAAPMRSEIPPQYRSTARNQSSEQKLSSCDPSTEGSQQETFATIHTVDPRRHPLRPRPLNCLGDKPLAQLQRCVHVDHHAPPPAAVHVPNKQPNGQTVPVHSDSTDEQRRTSEHPTLVYAGGALPKLPAMPAVLRDESTVQERASGDPCHPIIPTLRQLHSSPPRLQATTPCQDRL
jgi:hypothetical protein